MTLLSRSLLAGLVLTACATELGAPSASLTPEAPTTADDLVLDVDGAGSAVSVWWYVDDVEAPTLHDRLTVPATRTQKG